MAAVIKRQKWFRWHDAGDLYSHTNIWQKIIEVCKLTPDTQHWMPTQERQYLPDPEQVPANLIIRLSAAKVDGNRRQRLEPQLNGCNRWKPQLPGSLTQGGKCRECRACWNKDIKNISYGKH